jgi:hypothetical protein
MNKDREKKYLVVREMIKAGEVKTFGQIFYYIPKSVLSKDAGISYDKFERIKKNPRLMSVSDLLIIARLLHFKPTTLFEMVGKLKGAK